MSLLLGLVEHHGPLRQVEPVVAQRALCAQLLNLAPKGHLTELHHHLPVRLHGEQALRDAVLLPQKAL